MHTRWLFFDVGSTLVDEEAAWAQRFREQAQGEEAMTLGLTADIIRQEVVLNSIQRKPQYRTLIEKYHLKFAAPYRSEYEVLYADAAAVVGELASRYRLGVIANQLDGLQNRLQQHGILPFFSEIFSSWDYGILKPDIRLFEAALYKTGCPAGQAVMIGDRLDNDIHPANSLGMQTVWIRQGFGALQTPASILDKPDHTIDHLKQLLELY